MAQKTSKDFVDVMVALTRIQANISPSILNVNYVFNDLQNDMRILSSFLSDVVSSYENPTDIRVLTNDNHRYISHITASDNDNTTINAIPVYKSVGEVCGNV